MRGLAVAAGVVSLGILAGFLAADASAANTNRPPPVGVGTGTPTTSPSGNDPLHPKPTVHYTFDGNMNNILGGYGLTPDRRDDLHFDYVAGKDGKAPGAIDGLGVYQGEPRLFYSPAFTMQFRVFPTNTHDHAPTCSDGMIFFDGYYSPLPNGVKMRVYQNRVAITACPDAGNPKAKVSVSFFVENGADLAGADLSASLSMNAWHDVQIIVDPARHLLELGVDGSKTDRAIPGPVHPCGKAPAGQCVLEIGGPTDATHNWEYGLLDDFVYYPTANWPVKASPQALGHTAAAE